MRLAVLSLVALMTVAIPIDIAHAGNRLSDIPLHAQPHRAPFERADCARDAVRYSRHKLVAVNADEHRGCGRAMLRANPRLLLLAYVNASAVYPYWSRDLPGSAFARDAQGRKIMTSDGKAVMDPRSARWRQRLRFVALARMRRCGCNGVWVDEAGTSSYTWRNRYPVTPDVPRDRWLSAQLRNLREMERVGKVAANGISDVDRFYDHTSRMLDVGIPVLAESAFRDVRPGTPAVDRLVRMVSRPGVMVTVGDKERGTMSRARWRRWTSAVLARASRPVWVERMR